MSSMRGAGEHLRRLGLLNEMFSYSEFVSEPVSQQRYYFCTSERCAGQYVRGVKVTARNGYCTQCGHAVIVRYLTPDQLKDVERRERWMIQEIRAYDAWKRRREEQLEELRDCIRKVKKKLRTCEDGVRAKTFVDALSAYENQKKALLADKFSYVPFIGDESEP